MTVPAKSNWIMKPWTARGRSEIYPGWGMCAIAFICLVFIFGAPTAMMPIIYGSVVQEFGWTRSEATLFITYKYIVSAIVALFLIGPIIERFGVRTMVVLSGVSVALGMTSFLWIEGLVSYYLAGGLVGFGTGAIVICGNILVSRWFVRNQGLAIGIMVAGASAGGAVFPLIGTFAIEAWGWRGGMAFASLGIWLIALPLYLFFANENPTEADLVPEAPHAGDVDEEKVKEDLRAAELDEDLRGLMRMPMFWLKLMALFVVAVADNGMTQNTVLYLNNDVGLSPALAALSLSIVFAFGVPAKVFAGFVFDRFSLTGLRIWYVVLAGSILLAFQIQGLFTMILFRVLRGVAHGGLITGAAVITKQCFGLKHMDKVLPISAGVSSIGMGIGPVLMSYTRDVSGSYDLGFMLAAGLCVLGAILALGVKPLYWNRLRALRAR